MTDREPNRTTASRMRTTGVTACEATVFAAATRRTA